MSQLYARVFVKILESSLAEDWQTRHVFEDLLKLADDGVLDMTQEAISRRTNVPLDVIKDAITKLESPDLRSRDRSEEGRRLIRLDDHRDWGWLIVNWDRYESIRTAEDVRFAARERKRRQRERDKEHSNHPLTTPKKGTDSDTYPYTEGRGQNVTCHTQGVTSDVQMTLPTADENTQPHISKKNNNWKPDEMQKRLNALFKRRDTTRWQDNEIRLYKNLGTIMEEDMCLLERYYTGYHPTGKDYRRRTLETLLAHFQGELDVARRYKPFTGM